MMSYTALCRLANSIKPETWKAVHETLAKMAFTDELIRGSIRFLKRILGLAPCMKKGWKNYSSTVGATVFAHNLLVLTRC